MYLSRVSAPAGSHPVNHAVPGRLIVCKRCCIEIPVTRLNQSIAGVELGKAVAQYRELASQRGFEDRRTCRAVQVAAVRACFTIAAGFGGSSRPPRR